MSPKKDKFKIGQQVICDPNFNENSDAIRIFFEPDNERLIVGESYIVEDIDFHFPGKICVNLKGPYYFHSEFVPEELFTDDKSFIRDKKIDQVLS